MTSNQTFQKILVVHDEHGNVESVAFPRSKPKTNAGLRVQRGDEHVMEALAIDVELEQVRRNPRDTIENLRVDIVHARVLARHR